MKKVLLLGMMFFSMFGSLIAQQAVAPSFVQRQLDKLAQSRVVKEIAIFKDLPGAINRCYISKQNCTETDTRVISQALIRIPIIMAAFAAAAGIVFIGKKEYSRAVCNRLIDDHSKTGSKVPYECVSQKTQEQINQDMVVAITKGKKQYLIDTFAKITFSQNMLNTYLSLAVPSAESDIVAVLLQEGADASAKDGKGDPVLYSAARRSTFGPNEYAIARDIMSLLLQKGADVNAQGRDGRTALMWVAGAGRQDLADMLITAGANLSIKDKLGNTAQDYANDAPSSITLKKS